jgi:hypothetical protein
MRSPLHNDDFEFYLQQQAKQHRMYPSDQLWRNIQNQLHEKGRWPALTFISIIIITLLVIGTLLIKPADRLVNTVKQRVYNDSIQQNLAASQTTPTPLLEERLATEKITQQTIASAVEKMEEQRQQASLAIVSSNTNLKLADTIHPAALQNLNLQKTVVARAIPPAVPQAPAAQSQQENNTAAPLIFSPESFLQLSGSAGGSNRLGFGPDPNKNNTGFLPSSGSLAKNLAINRPAPPPQVTTTGKTPRFEITFYITPTMSYRRLINEKSNKNFLQTYLPVPAASNYSIDVNRVVRHKPALGFEFGALLGYKLNRQLTLKSGLQFNMRQYNIEAYGYQLEPASVALNGNQPDTLNSYTWYRNGAGSYPIVLHNRYYEISVPIGIDWKGWANKRLSWGISAFVQPTYSFRKDPFIITTDFKNYTNGSSLMRNWNINTSVETYLSYQMGDVRWQIGPQFRYQQLPTFKNKYPIKEYLLDYGIKLGITKSIR